MISLLKYAGACGGVEPVIYMSAGEYGKIQACWGVEVNVHVSYVLELLEQKVLRAKFEGPRPSMGSFPQSPNH